MKTIATINGFFNYGNRLQLFALSLILKEIDNDVNVYWPKRFSARIKEFIKYRTPVHYLLNREARIWRFTRKHTPKVTATLKNGTTVVVGSDQVWNPNFFKNRPYLLEVPGDCAKISYAASIGKEQLSDDEKARFKKALKEYTAISVRERSAMELLQPLTEKKVEVVLDPTLLLDKEEYVKLEKRPRSMKSNEKYILCYVLGGNECMDAIDKFASKKGYKVLPFSDRNDSKYGVEEFLYLIHHAEMVCTDSFHACVFSVIFERPFVVFKRTGKHSYMFTRLQNLIDTFQLPNRKFNGESITEQNMNIDYTEAKEILEKEREKSLKFLKTALGVCDESR